MCLFPIKATILPDGGRPVPDKEGTLTLPCGKCTECISKRSMEWALRAKHEISCHQESSFITLTYRPENLPSHTIVKTEFQLFMKKLRKRLKKKLNYMVSHEYGSTTFRPHHHVLIFGYNPPNQSLDRYSRQGHPLFTSPDIATLWSHGYHSIGEANEKTAYYIASYALKGKKHTYTDETTGELETLRDCMDVSKRPAIGLNYLLKNAQQLVDSETILPRYYLKKLEKYFPDLLQQYEDTQSLNLKTRSSRELHAKFVIDNQKKQMQNSEFRSAPFDVVEDKFHENYLKQERNLYASHKGKL